MFSTVKFLEMSQIRTDLELCMFAVFLSNNYSNLIRIPQDFRREFYGFLVVNKFRQDERLDIKYKNELLTRYKWTSSTLQPET